MDLPTRQTIPVLHGKVGTETDSPAQSWGASHVVMGQTHQYSQWDGHAENITPSLQACSTGIKTHKTIFEPNTLVTDNIL